MDDADRPRYPIPYDLSGDASHLISYPEEDETIIVLAQINVWLCFPYYDSLVELCNYGIAPTQRSLFRTFIHLQSNALCIFLFQTRFLKFWNSRCSLVSGFKHLF